MSGLTFTELIERPRSSQLPLRRHYCGIVIDHSKKYHNIPYYGVVLFAGHSKILIKLCLQFLLGVKMAPRETENNGYAKFMVNFPNFLHLVCKQYPKL